MGNGDEITVDHEVLTRAQEALDAQHESIHSMVISEAPPPSVFGGSSRGEWLANAVIKGNAEISRAKKETEEGLQRFSSAVVNARVTIEESDEYAAAVTKQMIAALEVMSNPLVLFNKNSGPLRNLPI